jgi:signal transduction histidine kinase
MDAPATTRAYGSDVHPALDLARKPSRPTRGDVVLVGVFLVWAVLEAVYESPSGQLWVRLLVAVGYTVPLLARRQAPIVVLLVLSGVVLARGFTADPPDDGAMPFPALLVATFSASLYARRLALAIAGVLIPVAVIAILSQAAPWDDSHSPVDYAIFLFFVSGAWTAGYLIRRRAAQVRAAEAAGGELARASVVAERARIARELHDIVAHSVSIIALQSGAAEALVESEPAKAREHMETVRKTAHEALGEMRRLLDVLREDEPLYAPQPGFGGIPELVEDSRRAGLPVELREEGNGASVPQGVALAAYRIVQESLTNVRKHAGRVPTTVVVRRSPRSVELDVVNAAGRRDGDLGGSGRGLAGMRERARIYGGTFAAGPLPDGGFAVRAILPLEGPDA